MQDILYLYDQFSCRISEHRTAAPKTDLGRANVISSEQLPLRFPNKDQHRQMKFTGSGGSIGSSQQLDLRLLLLLLGTLMHFLDWIKKKLHFLLSLLGSPSSLPSCYVAQILVIIIYGTKWKKENMYVCAQGWGMGVTYVNRLFCI